MAAGKLIPIRVDGVEIEVETVPVTGTEPTSGKVSKVAGDALDAFGRAQQTIVAVANSTAAMIDGTGAAARPDGVEVEFGLKFSASGGVIMAGASGEASLKVTLTYDVAKRRAERSASPSPGSPPPLENGESVPSAGTPDETSATST